MRQLRYAGLNKKRRPAAGHSFAGGFLPNGGHPLVLFRWTFWCVRDCSMLSRMPLLLQELSIRSCNSGSAGKNRKPLSTTRFLATKPQVAEVQNRGLVGRSRFYPALPESQHGSMRQILGLSSTPAFSRKETAGRSVAAFRCARHVSNLPHTSVFLPLRQAALLQALS